MWAIFIILTVAAAFPAENVTQDLQNVQTLHINITLEDVKVGRQDGDVEDAVDLAAENGGLQLATHIVNLLLGGFSGIGQAITGAGGGGGANANANGGTTGGTAGTAGGAAAAKPKPKLFI